MHLCRLVFSEANGQLRSIRSLTLKKIVEIWKNRVEWPKKVADNSMWIINIVYEEKINTKQMIKDFEIVKASKILAR